MDPIGMISATVQDSHSLGEMIRRERKRQNLTQEQLAAVAGVGVRFVREMERGKETCRIGLAIKVMHTLGLSLVVSSR